VTVDGIIDSEWDNAPQIVLDDISKLYKEENWKGYRDLSVAFSAMYDEDYFYFRATVTDEDFCQEMDAPRMWKGDCIQLGLYNDADGLYAKKKAEPTYDGLDFGFVGGEPVVYRTQCATDIYPRSVVEQNEDLEFKCRQENIDTIYEIKVGWDNTA